jgi:hypothetical protein
MITPEWCVTKRKEYGASSPFCTAKIDAEFPDASENAVTTRKDLDRAAALYEAGPLAAKMSATVPWSLGVDVGRGGDPSAVCWLRGHIVHGVESMPTPTGQDAADFVRRTIRELQRDPFGLGTIPVQSVVIDAIGIGASPVDLLTAAGLVLTEFHGNGRSEDEHCLNARMEAFKTLSALLADGQLAIKYDEELWEELLALSYFVNERGRMQMVSKDDLRGSLGRSPNKADALAMAVYEAETGASVGGSLFTF